MTYCSFSDPGQLQRDRGQGGRLGKLSARSDKQDPFADEMGMPKRAYKSWQYKRPVRRYDHYCRWLANCIGLLNHREFVAMLVGLVLIGGLGIVVDVLLTVAMVNRGFWDS